MYSIVRTFLFGLSPNQQIVDDDNFFSSIESERKKIIATSFLTACYSNNLYDGTKNSLEERDFMKIKMLTDTLGRGHGTETQLTQTHSTTGKNTSTHIYMHWRGKREIYTYNIGPATRFEYIRLYVYSKYIR